MKIYLFHLTKEPKYNQKSDFFLLNCSFYMKITKMMNVGVYSFFAGSGFLDLGFEKTEGVKINFVNEIHEPFLDSYKYSRSRLNLDEPIYGYSNTDITHILEENLLSKIIGESKKKDDLTGFIGGPPCPDFSIAGKNKGRNGKKGILSQTYIDLICKYKPDFFLFENVKGLYRTTKHKIFFTNLKAQLAENGYFLTEKLVNALEYGVPQDRDRIILIGFRNKALKFAGLNRYSDKNLNQSFNWNLHTKYRKESVLSIDWPTSLPFCEDSSLEMPPNVIESLCVQHWFNKNMVTGHPNSENCFNPKSNKFTLIREGDDSKKSYKRLHRWRYSPTAAYGNNEVHLHPYKARRITAAEALAIQSLPIWFVLPEDMTLTNMFKTIGNGVPYLLAKGLAQTIIDFVTNSRDENINSKQSNLIYQPIA